MDRGNFNDIRLDVAIDLRATSRGGRERAILSGYRPLLRFRGAPGDYLVGLAELVVEREIHPGSHARGKLYLARIQEPYVRSDIAPGTRIGLMEGDREIGTATVLAVHI